LDRIRQRILALGDDPANDIAVGHDADRMFGQIDDGNRPAVELHHELGNLVEHDIRRADDWVSLHDVANQHTHGLSSAVALVESAARLYTYLISHALSGSVSPRGDSVELCRSTRRPNLPAFDPSRSANDSPAA